MLTSTLLITSFSLASIGEIPITPISTSSTITAASHSNLGERVVKEAEKYLGVSYVWGGRKSSALDCWGLLFRSYSDVFGFSWKEIFAGKKIQRNIDIVESGFLGTPATGLDGIMREDLQPENLQAGDVLYFLLDNFDNSVDTPLLVRRDKEYRTWHTGLYKGGTEHLVVHASPSQGVSLTPLEELKFDALYVTRRGTN